MRWSGVRNVSRAYYKALRARNALHFAMAALGVSPTSSTFEIIEMGEDGILTEQTASEEDTGDGGPVAADRPPFSVDDKDCTEHEGAVKTGRGGGGAGFEIGQRVTDEKYGRGVLKWIGYVGGEKMAGIELVRYTEARHARSPSLPPPPSLDY